MRQTLPLALCLMLAACSWLPLKEPTPSRSATEITQWDLRAAIVASGAQSGRASLRWQQRDEQFTITVSGPFGVGSTRLQGTLSGVTVTRGDQRYFSADPASDLARAVGAPVPLPQLSLWVRGLAGDGGRSSSASRWTWGDWQVSIAEREPVGEYLLPAQILLVGKDQQLELRRMRWVLPETPEG